MASVRPDQSFKGRQFTAEVILWAVRWYLMFSVSYRDLELMLADRGVEIVSGDMESPSLGDMKMPPSGEGERNVDGRG